MSEPGEMQEENADLQSMQFRIIMCQNINEAAKDA